MTTPQNQRLRVNLLSGYLGSGKTTILNGLLRHPEMQRTAVIVNEFGEIGIDHLLVAKSSDNVIELSNGCLCCTIQSDLVTTLFGLFADRVKEKILPFDRVIIETTGLAEPAPILLTLFRDPVIAPRFSLDSVLIVVDSVNGAATLDNQPESVNQVAAADRLLLTKTDIETSGKVAVLKERLEAINPGCPIDEIRNGVIDPSVLSVIALHEHADPELAARRWLRTPVQGVSGAEREHRHAHTGARSPYGGRIDSQVAVFDDEIEWADLLAWVDVVRRMLGPNLLRIKGLLTIAGRSDGPLVVHAVQNVFHPPKFMPSWPSSDHRSRLVFIVRDIDPSVIQDTLTLLKQPASHAAV